MNAMVSIDRSVLASMPLPTPGDEAQDKDARGRAFVVAGSALSPGAALLAGTAVLRSGAGKVAVGAPCSLAVTLGLLAPELGIISFDQSSDAEPDASDTRSIDAGLNGCDAILVGPGLTDEANCRRLVINILRKTEKQIVLDAAGITGFSKDGDSLRRASRPLIITPHDGEFATLTGLPRDEVRAHRPEVAAEAASQLNCVVVLKGPDTVVAEPDGKVWLHRGGVVGLATAGSGDVLAGILTGLVARGADPVAACLWSVFVHAEAGRILTESVGALGFLARELLPHIPALISKPSAKRATAASTI
jgi:ADP-dependent NAD(P)H-hydrate dehydratase